MSDKHLGDRIHDLLDGRLSRTDTHAAMAHLDHCEECSTRWKELRAAREALNSSSAGIDMRFAQMLLDKERMAQIASNESKHVARAARGRDRRPTTIAAALAIILGFTVGAAYVAGSPDIVTGEFVSAAFSSGERSAAVMDADAMASAEMADWVQPNWKDSGLIPIEARILRQSDSQVLVASLLVGMEPVYIAEQRGRLSVAVKEEAPRIVVNGVDVYVVNAAPTQVLWQSGPIVLGASCKCPLETLSIVVASFPQSGEPGVVDQISAGFGVLGGALTGR